MRLLAFFLILLPSCAMLPRPATTPVKTIAAGKTTSSELVIVLPGRWSSLREYRSEGIVELAEKRWPRARIVIPDLHLAYYREKTAAERIREDVILPARKDGVKTIRVVGISMGGLGGLIYDIEHPGEIDELILLSPFLGEDEVIQEIRAAGGLKYWRSGPIADDDFSRKLWVSLREKWLVRGDRPKVFLGCGESDRLADSSRLFAAEFLSANEQQWIPGTHDWETWRRLLMKN